MFSVPAFFIGALIGLIRARRLGGNLMDQIQYAVAHGLALFLLALIFTTIALNYNWI